MPRNTRLYDVLGVSPEASEDEIRRAYKKMALKYHPDKAGPQAAATFQKIREAHEVLTDVEKKRVYDMYGDQGLQLYDSGMGDMAGFMIDPKIAIGVSILGPIVVMIIAIVPILLCVHVDTKARWTWWGVSIPAVIIESLLLCCTGLAVCMKDEAKARVVRPQTAVKVACVLVFTILLTVGLDGHIKTWPLVFIPLYLVELLSLMELPFEISPATYRESKAVSEEDKELGIEPIRESYAKFVARRLRGLWRPLCLILIVLKVSGALGVSWGIVLLPMFLRLLWFHAQPLMMVWKAANGTIFPDLCCGGCLVSFFFLVHAAFWTLITLKLDGVGHYKLAVAFIPLWVVLGLCMCLCCAQFMWFKKKFHGDGDEEEGDKEGTSDTSATPLAQGHPPFRRSGDVENPAQATGVSSGVAGSTVTNSTLDID